MQGVVRAGTGGARGEWEEQWRAGLGGGMAGPQSPRARRACSVAVLERRGVLGGAAVSESDLVPGFRFSRCSYLLSLLRPAILR